MRNELKPEDRFWNPYFAGLMLGMVYPGIASFYLSSDQGQIFIYQLLGLPPAIVAVAVAAAAVGCFIGAEKVEKYVTENFLHKTYDEAANPPRRFAFASFALVSALGILLLMVPIGLSPSAASTVPKAAQKIKVENLARRILDEPWNVRIIDPHLHLWGWEVSVYLFLGGLAAGIMVFCALLVLRRGMEDRSTGSRWVAFLAPLILSLGMLTLLMDLEYKFHVWRFYAAFKITSPMSWGSWILLLIYPATLAIGLATLTATEIDRVTNLGLIRQLGLAHFLRNVHAWLACRVRGLAWLNLLLGIALGVYTGVLLGTLGARPAWNSALLGPLFLVSGVSTGAALMMLLPMKHGEHALIQRWDMGAILVEAALLFLFLTSLLTGGGQPGRDAAGLFLGGSYTAPFWALVVIAGLAVPLMLETIELVEQRRPTVWAPLLLLIGGLALRFIIVAAGQA